MLNNIGSAVKAGASASITAATVTGGSNGTPPIVPPKATPHSNNPMAASVNPNPMLPPMARLPGNH